MVSVHQSLNQTQPSSHKQQQKQHLLYDMAATATTSTSNEQNHWCWWRHFIAGATAGCVSRSVTAPLDRLKVFLQVIHIFNISNFMFTFYRSMQIIGHHIQYDLLLDTC